MTIYKNDGTSLEIELSTLDSLSITAYDLDSLATASNWVCFIDNPSESIELSEGTYEQVEEGIKIYGLGTTNDKSIKLMPVFIPSATQRTIYLKWKADNNGNEINVGIEFFSDSEGLVSIGKILNLSAESSLENDAWYYTRISENSGTIKSITSIGNYDNKGGQVISSENITGEIGTFSFQLYADKNSYAILAESRFE